MITLYVPRPDAPLTAWQRSERFATMRAAQRDAAALREEAAIMRRYRTEFHGIEDPQEAYDSAAMWEHLAQWLGKSVRPE
ncbi:hypothetical protein [Streptomyces chartreusis]|uniref:Uncharacterized protein n=1 Tax=Streptomyces chartreusis TaxID=1969 RepID=A0A7H8TA74_STRCX|nr:hypothetical protein [Streptomyces chartreusis]QKZ20386.1 hypothetical protein HUT05_25365 [Streptomyces chartreusis]